MKSQILLLALGLAAPLAAAGTLECDPRPVQEGVPAIYHCIYRNGTLAQAYAAMRDNPGETRAPMLDLPQLPHTLPARCFTRHVQLRDEDSNAETYPAEISLRRLGKDRVMIQYADQAETTPYSRSTLLQRKGRDIEITITEIAP